MVDSGNAYRGDGTAFEAADQDASQGIAKRGGLAAIERADQEGAGLGSVFRDLVLNAIDLVMQHGLKGRKVGESPGGQERNDDSDATALGATATVVGKGSHVADQGDFKAGNLQGSDCGFAA